MHGTDVRYEMVNGDDSQAGSVAVQADGVRPAVLFDDNRLSVIVTGMHGLVDSATFVRQGQVLLSVDARFPQHRMGRWVRRLHGRLHGIVSTEFQDGSLLVFRRAVLERVENGSKG